MNSRSSPMSSTAEATTSRENTTRVTSTSGWEARKASASSRMTPSASPTG